ncbi:pentapeptide repeat-containing protein [Pantanalinema rosaneae CENA516]|uniref:pentapeptide repeat-containing protein n=1 Tax=Pantanalinema rosaneae TaxID=1620701 RepID=UPI003D6FA67E
MSEQKINLETRIKQVLDSQGKSLVELIRIAGLDPLSDFSESDLSEISFVGEKLARANFYGTKFNKANFSKADLSQADLRQADLSEANLSDAILTGANLEGANLEGANLRNANLAHCNLVHANLVKVDLTNADLRGVDLSSTNLLEAKLDGIKHTPQAKDQKTFGTITTKASIYDGYYAQYSRRNIGHGKSESAARADLKASQEQQNKKQNQ